jgi:hypothetical protein
MKIIKFFKGIYNWKNFKESFEADPVGTLMIGLIFYFVPIVLLWGMCWNNFILPYIR